MLQPARPWLATALRRALALAAAGVLAACATLPQAPPPERIHSGRFAVTTTLDGHSENTTGRFILAVSGPHLTLDLATPLGTTLARIQTSPAGAVLSVPGPAGLREAHGRDAEALAEEVLGWPLPAAGIGDWIEGRPAPGRASRVQDADGRIDLIEQDGWTIEVAERFDGGAPRRLVFTRPALPARGMAPPAPAITLRLVLDDGVPADVPR
jgi:outer membrane lipoprotein LolB